MSQSWYNEYIKNVVLTTDSTIQHPQPTHYEYNWYMGTSTHKLFNNALKAALADYVIEND